MSKNIDEKVDQMEEAVNKYASADTVVSIGGYAFTPAKLMVAFTLVSTILGGLYGAFEVYKDYMAMKEAITSYVAPDLTELNKKIEMTEKKVEAMKDSVDQAVDYTNNIKNDLKADIRRVERVAEGVERDTKRDLKDAAEQIKEVQKEMRQSQKDMDASLKAVERGVDMKIKKALDNPLSN